MPPARRRRFKQALTELRISHLRITPHSLRRGGATAYFRHSGSFALTAQRGNWASVATCRAYINEGLALHIDSGLGPKDLAELRRTGAGFSAMYGADPIF